MKKVFPCSVDFPKLFSAARKEATEEINDVISFATSKEVELLCSRSVKREMKLSPKNRT